MGDVNLPCRQVPGSACGDLAHLWKVERQGAPAANLCSWFRYSPSHGQGGCGVHDFLTTQHPEMTVLPL